MDRKRFRLDGWDVGLFFIGVAAGFAFGTILKLWQPALLGVSAGTAAISLRRRLRPNDASLMYEERPQQVTWTLIPMLVVGIGALLSIFGLLGFVAVGLAANDPRSEVELGWALVPVILCAAGGWAIHRGITWSRRSSEHSPKEEQSPSSDR